MLISNREELAEKAESEGRIRTRLVIWFTAIFQQLFLFPENRGNTLASLLLVILYSLYSYPLVHTQVDSTIGSSAPSSPEYGVQKRGQAGPIRRPLFIERQIMHALAAN